MEILSHVNKRVKGHPSIKLPLRELLPLAAVVTPATTTTTTTATPDDTAAAAPASPAVSAAALSMVRSFALVYLEMAFERSTPEERKEAVSGGGRGEGGKGEAAVSGEGGGGREGGREGRMERRWFIWASSFMPLNF